jgi:hypothetical protein
MKKALIIGPTYNGANAKLSTVNDIANWKATLSGRGFTSITVKSGRLTRSVIQSAVKSWTIGLSAVDQGAEIWLGHSGRVPDTSGDEPDSYDEAFASSEILPITDDWIRATTALSKTSKLDIVAECCYAGTITRSPACNGPPKVDACIFPQGGPVFDPEPISRVNIPTITNHRLWAACGEGELSYGAMFGGKPNSVFSMGLCYWLRTYPAMNATDLMANVGVYVAGIVPAQHPQLEGINLDGVPF